MEQNSESQLSKVENPLAGAPGAMVLKPGAEEIKAAVEKVRDAYDNVRDSLFALGDAILELRAEYARFNDGKEPTNKWIAGQLALDLTEQRIGQLADTAKAFPPDLRREGIDFKAYEVARLTSKAMLIQPAPEEVAAVVAEQKSSPRVKEALHKLCKPQISIGVAYHSEGAYLYGLQKPNESMVCRRAMGALVASAIANSEADAFLRNVGEISSAFSEVKRAPRELQFGILDNLRARLVKMRKDNPERNEERRALYARVCAAMKALQSPTDERAEPDDSDAEELDFATSSETEDEAY